MNARPIIDALAALLSPPACVGCGKRIAADEAPLCSGCLERFEGEKSTFEAYLHGKSAPSPLGEEFAAEIYLAAYSPSRAGKDVIADKMAYAMKNGRSRELYSFIARQLAAKLYMTAVDGRKTPGDNELKELSKRYDYIIPLPRSKKNARKYGVDQSVQLSRRISEITGIPAFEALKNVSSSVQHELSAEERAANAGSSVGFAKAGYTELIKDKSILLIDDVVTTGSSVKAAAALLSGAFSITLLAPFKTTNIK